MGIYGIFIIRGIAMKKIIKYIDKPLFIITFILFVFGLIMIFSASNVTAYMKYAVSPYNYFMKQGVFLIAGFVLSLIIIRFNTKSYGFFSWGLMLIFIAALVLVLFYGEEKNQAVSWFKIGFISIQPSEFIKVVTIVFLANYYDKNQNKLNKWKTCLFPLLFCLITASLIFIQPDFGTTVIYCVIVGIIFVTVPISSGIKYKTILGAIGVVVGGVLALMSVGKGVLLERQMQRFDYAKPCDKILSSGSQVCNCYIAINNGGLTGVGLGNSTQKYLYLPEPYTDFIFAIVVEELGVVTGVALIILYMIILLRILMIGRASPNNRGAVMCYGVACYIFLHIAVNLMGIMGMIPLTGVPLPFMSYGGSFTICLIAALTIVQRVSVENGILGERENS